MFATPNALTSQSLGFKLEPNPHLYKGNDLQSQQSKDRSVKSPIDKLIEKANSQKNGILQKMERNNKLTQDQIVDELANIELSDEEEGDGRSVAQEVDYSNRKRAMREIKKANYD